MGVFQNHLMAAAVAKAAESTDFYTHQIANSIRFNKGDSPYLYMTPSAGGDQKTWAISFWAKRCGLGLGSWGNEAIMAWDDGASGGAYSNIIMFHRTGDKLDMGTGATPSVQTNLSYRDLTGWYHIAILADTTQATDTNRWKIYTNGVEQSLGTSNYPDQNYDFVNVASSTVYIGKGGGSAYSAGSANLYLAEMAFVEGTASSIGDFGEFKNGVWIPKDLSGLTFGDEGWWLNFASSGDLGNDVSGNNNDFTVSGLAAADQMLDSPTFDSSSNGGNFCTLGPLFKTDNVTFSEGNLKISSTTNNVGAMSNWAITDNTKWYWEGIPTFASAHEGYIGINYGDANLAASEGATGLTYYSANGNKIYEGTRSTYGATWTTGDIIGVAVDRVNDTVQFYKNNTGQGTIDISGLSDNVFYPYLGFTGGTGSQVWINNFGQDGTFAGTKTAQDNADENGYGNFYYSPPSGFVAICSGNLPTPAADPASEEGPENYFTNKIYTGDGASTLTISGLEFQPDFTWIKNRDEDGDSHCLFDSTRGVTKVLHSDTTANEATDADTLKSWTSDGYTVGADVKVNTNTEKYASWNWKANGGTTSSNGNGTITSTVQADDDRGFSIVKFTGDGNDNATVGHGLSSAPDMIIVKPYESDTLSWHVFHRSAGTGEFILNTGAVFDTRSTSFTTGGTTATTFTLGSSASNMNDSGNDTIAYCFANKEGYIKAGAYDGNGDADGTFVYIGFRPEFVLVKATTQTESWQLFDSARDPYNVVEKSLQPDNDYAEGSGSTRYVDFLSNGFKWRATWEATNRSGYPYIFLAFAKNPFKYATAR